MKTMKMVLQKIMMILAAFVVMLCTSSYASGTCGVKGCCRTPISGGCYCRRHTCSRYNCKNLAEDDGYCSEHRKKPGGSSASGSPKTRGSESSSSAAKTCIVSGCRGSRMEESFYCSKHKCGRSGCKEKADGSGYCSRHHSCAGDPYDVYDYDDPDDFYFDWEEDFEDYEDAEDYWESAWDW